MFKVGSICKASRLTGQGAGGGGGRQPGYVFRVEGLGLVRAAG